MARKMRAAIYARVSTVDKGQDPEVQLRPLRKYCRARGLDVADEYVDIGQSGAKDRRPELDKLMEAARKRQVDVVLVWRLDTRQIPEAPCGGPGRAWRPRRGVYVLPGEPGPGHGLRAPHDAHGRRYGGVREGDHPGARQGRPGERP